MSAKVKLKKSPKLSLHGYFTLEVEITSLIINWWRGPPCSIGSGLTLLPMSSSHTVSVMIGLLKRVFRWSKLTLLKPMCLDDFWKIRVYLLQQFSMKRKTTLFLVITFSTVFFYGKCIVSLGIQSYSQMMSISGVQSPPQKLSQVFQG